MRKTLDWLNFSIFSPRAFRSCRHTSLKNIDGAAYVRDYNFKYLPGTGPYIVSDNDIRKGKVRQRQTPQNDYWAEKSRWSIGQNNFDEVRLLWSAIPTWPSKCSRKAISIFIYVNRSLYWVKEMNFDAVQRGLVQKRKVFNNLLAELQGYAMNTTP